jgi:dienelactone hydrolase
MPQSRCRPAMLWLRMVAAGLFFVFGSFAADAQRTPSQQPVKAARDAQATSSTAALPETVQLMTDIFETVLNVPVTLKLADGRLHTGEMVVTHYRPQGSGPFPVVVLHHGRSLERSEPKRFRSVGSVRYWIRRGFAVIVPTRLGYGHSGLKPDPDFSSRECDNRTYAPAMAAMLAQTEAVLAMARALPWIDGSRVVIAGQSYGGFAAIGASGHAIRGLVGAINFAGGGGGNPKTRPGNPCGPDKLADSIAAAGRTARVPMLWLYSMNDQFWGSELPRRWHQAYVKAGGTAELMMLPPVGEDGHKLIGEGFSLWRPHVDRYLASLGFKPPRAVSASEATAFAPLDAIDQVPYLGENARAEGYAKFLGGDLPRAFAIAPNGAWGASWGATENAAHVALERCGKHIASGCKLYAVDDTVVWRPEVLSTGIASGR